MCGRYTLTANLSALQETFPWLGFPPELLPRYNIAPSQPVAVVPNDGKNLVDFFVWGLIPSWAKDPAIGNHMINARAETLSQKPSFRSAFKYRRCLILTDGFFEWKREGKSKTPMYIRMKSGHPFAFAGLWEIWHSPDGSEIRSCAIITTEPNTLLGEIHNRMPVILPQDAFSLWLDPAAQDSGTLSNLLKPYPAREMVAFPVSRLVNNPNSDIPEIILPN